MAVTVSTLDIRKFRNIDRAVIKPGQGFNLLVGRNAQGKTSTLEAIYQFIGEPWFEHDFDNVVYDADEFDLALGAPGLHTIRRKVEFIPRQTVLPPQLFHRFDDDMFWRVPGANRNNVRIISRP